MSPGTNRKQQAIDHRLPPVLIRVPNVAHPDRLTLRARPIAYKPHSMHVDSRSAKRLRKLPSRASPRGRDESSQHRLGAGSRAVRCSQRDARRHGCRSQYHHGRHLIHGAGHRPVPVAVETDEENRFEWVEAHSDGLYRASQVTPTVQTRSGYMCSCSRVCRGETTRWAPRCDPYPTCAAWRRARLW